MAQGGDRAWDLKLDFFPSFVLTEPLRRPQQNVDEGFLEGF